MKGRVREDAIYEACLLRFRPIMMTTMAALLGALPLALGTGRLGTAPAARHHDRRRTDREPDADAVHDAGDLSISGSPSVVLRGGADEALADTSTPGAPPPHPAH